jgi:hypothetical protein
VFVAKRQHRGLHASGRCIGGKEVERRTGSLFPPSARYELARIPLTLASQLFDRMLSLSGVAADPPLADAVVQGLGRGQPLLAADLQIAAMAMVVDAKDESAAAFYRHYGFVTLQAQPSRLFLPMRLVAQLLG